MREQRDDLETLDEEISALVDGELDPEREAQLKARAAREPELARRLAAFRRLDTALRALPGSDVPEHLATRLRERIASEPDRVIPSRRRVFTWGASGAALAAGLLLALLLGREPEPSSAPPSPDLEFAGVPEEELGVAVELDTLADFEVIEQLELLELLAALDEPERS